MPNYPNKNSKKAVVFAFLFKNPSFFCLILSVFLVSQTSFAQSEHLLKSADSLFASGRYTEALSVYEHLLVSRKEFSPQMLLKMAFVEESQNNYPQALYYLNFYYRISPDRQVLKKLEELANTHQLEGYQYTDKTYFLSLYDTYRWYIIALFGIVILLMVFWLIRRKRQERTIVPPLVIGLSVILTLVLLHNFATQRTIGIIRNDYTTFVENPSAAAPVLKVIKKGNGYDILGKQDTWYKVSIDDQVGYVRLHNTLVIR